MPVYQIPGQWDEVNHHTLWMPRWFLDPVTASAGNRSFREQLLSSNYESPWIRHPLYFAISTVPSALHVAVRAPDSLRFLQNETNWTASIPSFNLFPRMHPIVFFFQNPCQNAEENEVAVAGLVQRRDLLFAAAAFHQLKHWQRSLTNICQILQTKPRNSKAAVLK